MNVVLLSPNFPPQFYLFARALQQHGHAALGVGDVSMRALRLEQQQAMTAWYRVGSLARYDEVLRGVAFLIHRHGRIDRIESFNEHWLPVEARLREDFNVAGPSRADVRRHLSKSTRREIFRSNGIDCVPGERVTSSEQVRAFVARYGLPVLFKPDTRTPERTALKASTADQVEAALQHPLDGYVVERFEPDRLTSIDGLTDAQGRIVYRASHVFESSASDSRAAVYWSRRDIPKRLDDIGAKVVEAFRIRERFFHCELFEDEDGTFLALDVNLRPPYGFATDLMNYASDIDVYNLWARILSGEDVARNFKYDLKYHVAHVGRRRGVSYAFEPDELVQRLGDLLILHRPIPDVFKPSMGDEMYILRHKDKQRLFEGIELATR